MRVLDLGCGNGRFAEFLAQNLDQNIKIEYVGIDSSGELLELAQKHLSKIERAYFSFELINQNLLD